MNKWKALFAAMLVVVGMSACTNGETESEDAQDTSINEAVAAEKSTDKIVRETYAPGEDKIIMHMSVALETEDTSLFTNDVNPYYDNENKTLVFAIDREVSYDDEFSCDIAATGEGDFIVVDGTLVTDEYAVLCTENGYRGAAIKLDQEIAPGTYNFNVNFSYFTVSFRLTVE